MSVAGLLRAMRSNRPPAERLVWMCLENHANGERFWRISALEIAAELHLCGATVFRALAALERDGEITCTRRGGRAITFHLSPSDRLNDEKRSPVSKEDSQNASPFLGISKEDSQNESPGLSKCESSELRKNPPFNPPEESVRSDSFSQWFGRYPRKRSRGAAAAAYAQAIGRGATPAELLAGLERYPFDPNPRFQPYPATWLHGDCWLDGPDAPAAASATPAENRPAPSAIPGFEDAPPDPQGWLARWVATRGNPEVNRTTQVSLIRQHNRDLAGYLIARDAEAARIAEARGWA